MVVSTNHATTDDNHELPSSKEKLTRQGWSTLRFRANLSYTSPPAPLPPFRAAIGSKEKALADFMAHEHARNQLLSGTGNLHPSSMLSLSNHRSMALWLRFRDEAQRLLPEMTILSFDKADVDFIRLRMQTSFLVFTIMATAILGHHQLSSLSPPTNPTNAEPMDEDSSVTIQTPQHTLLLLQEDFQVQGPPPLVWIFEQLTGVQKRHENRRQKHTHHGLFRYWAESIPNDRVIFRSETQAEIGFEFPSFLLKILPVPKEVIEEQGNISLKKSMQRDVSAGMEKLQGAYLDWLDTLR